MRKTKSESSFTQHHFSRKSGAGFTLIELVIVIGILAILAVVVILTINPSEFLKQTRDSRRLSELQTINTALGQYQADGGTSLGLTNKVYVSIPDSSETCQNLGLPSLPTGWEYRCSNSTNYRKVDSTGWIPVNFSSVSYSAPLNILPIDPVNATSTGEYYTYVTGGSWNLSALFESERYKMAGSSDKTSKDGGSYPELYEIGTNLTLLPVSRDPSLVGYWKLDETSGALYDSSGHGNNGTQSGGVTYSATGKVGNALSFDGVDDYVNVVNSSSLDMSNSFTIEVWIKIVSLPSWRNQIVYRETYLNKGFRFGVTAASKVTFWTSQSGGSIDITTGTLSLNTFYHITFVYTKTGSNTGNANLYVNGVADGSGSGTLVPPTTDIKIGSTGTELFFSGLIDDVRIYNRALSAAEIMAIYNATK